MKENMQIVFGLLGGLAVFIYGMNLMSESLQKAAGEKMKSILALLTKNRIMGVIAGALVTAVLQSSSATTVMAIGFVSAGLMSLPQAISIIFGANIGTTMTAQIIAFKITDYIYAFIFIGFILTFVCKSERIKSIGQTIFAFGLLFLGIETMGGVATRLIERNTTIPTRKSQIFSTAADNQTAVDIHVVQGERQFARDNKTLGQFRLDGIPPARRGVPQIEVTFDIDANGIVNVSAKDLGTGKEQHITITSGSNMSDSDIDKAVKEAAEYEAQDKKRKEAIDARNDADSMVFQTEKALEEVGDKIDANDKAEVEADLNALKEAINRAPVDQMTDAQVEDIKSGKEKLMNSAQKLFAKVYEQAQQAGAGAGPNMGGANAGNAGSSKPDDDVVDADFKEV